MENVSRNNLKIPKNIKIYEKNVNSVDDTLFVKEVVNEIDNIKYNKEKLKEVIERDDVDLKVIDKIPSSANDLIVITVVKKLCAYVILVTEKSPKKYRGVFVNRMQNYCLDTLECLLSANYLRIDSIENKRKREDLQKEAIVKLKLLGYVSMVSESVNCILKKQYKQISMQLAEAINLIIAWKKSDDERFKKRIISPKAFN